MCSQELVQPCFKVMKTRYLKSNSILKAIRSSLPVATKLAEFGTLIRELNVKCWTGMKMKFSPVRSIMKEIR